MLKVECYSGYKVNERPTAFSLMDRHYQVKEVIDRWYGEGSSYFKVKADDDNIYLLKYEGDKDQWDLIFYQNPRKLQALPHSETGFPAFSLPVQGIKDSKRFTPLN